MYVFIYLSIRLFIYLFIYSFIYLFISIYMNLKNLSLNRQNELGKSKSKEICSHLAFVTQS